MFIFQACFNLSSRTHSDTDKFEEEIENVLEQANIIISLAHKKLSEEDIEDIIEDKRSRGVDVDDIDI